MEARAPDSSAPIHSWETTVIKEHDLVVLTEDLPTEGLKAGDVGTVVHVYADGNAYEVEFVTGAGQTLALEF